MVFDFLGRKTRVMRGDGEQFIDAERLLTILKRKLIRFASPRGTVLAERDRSLSDGARGAFQLPSPRAWTSKLTY